MSEENQSLDITGLGKIAEAIPEKSWNKLVDTACDNFSKLIAPITETFYGLGQLIKSKFQRMVDAQKVLAADSFYKVDQKIKQSKNKIEQNPKATVIIAAIENASNETDENIRDIWANLIANEFLTNDVHPEFVNILKRLTSKDASILVEIAQKSNDNSLKKLVNELAKSFVYFAPLGKILQEKVDFNRAHLTNLKLIKKNSGIYELTVIGEEFLKAVADPTFIEKANIDNN